MPIKPPKTIYTSSQAARVIGVSIATLKKSIGAGMLSCYRVPGGVDRRFTRKELERYMVECGMGDMLDRLDTEWDVDQRLLMTSRNPRRKRGAK